MRLDLDRITAALAGQLDQKRFMHTLGVVQSSAILAQSQGFDVERACVAALLHDVARGFSSAEVEQMAREPDYGIDPMELEFPSTLHAVVGAVLVRRQFGVDDAEVLDAIAFHPTGCKDPSPTLQVLIAADYCEPTRDFPGVDELRALVRRDFAAGLRRIVKVKLDHVRSRGKKPHPRAFETIRSLGVD